MRGDGSSGSKERRREVVGWPSSVCVMAPASLRRHISWGAKLKKEHFDFLAGGNRDAQRSCLRASAESQSSDCWQELTEEKEAGKSQTHY